MKDLGFSDSEKVVRFMGFSSVESEEKMREMKREL